VSASAPDQAAAQSGANAGAAAGDIVARYCAASQANDVDALIALFAPDGELVSPLSGRMVFKGHDSLRVLLGAVYGTLKDLRWGEQVGEGRVRTVIAQSRFAGLRLDDAMVFELDGEQRIRRLRPHLRPWLATTAFALALGPKVAAHPGVLMRALRAS